jgi:2-polyprenyl-3-methyl-5-hydroxy-6-metoxy-1,4-benzoquinol methylase
MVVDKTYSTVKNEFIVNPNRVHVAGYFSWGEQPSGLIKWLVEKFKPGTVLDVGSGPMGSKKLFNLFGVQYVWCVDGDSQLLDRKDLTEHLKTFSVIDLERSSYIFPIRFDMVFSYEVAEHISNVDNYIETITENCAKILVMTHALKGQGGHGHVNEQPDEYWISRIEKKGFKYLEKESKDGRVAGLIFERL